MTTADDTATDERWRDPSRLAALLTSFARTEAEGGDDLRAAAARVVDPWLREHLTRHAQDELRHAALFRARAAELRGDAPIVDDVGVAQPGSPTERDSHGFLRVPELSAEGDIAFVAFLHVAEGNAEALFRKAIRATRHDPRTQSVFAEILRDELYHVAWTKEALHRWRKAGRRGEVSRALAAARGKRFLGGLALAAARVGHGVGRTMLRIAYFTVFAPFAWAARRAKSAPTYVVAPAPAGTRTTHESQYG